MENVQNSKIRIDFLDVAKAFSIIFVVMTHCFNPATDGTFPFWTKTITSYAMSLFFTLSGLTTHRITEYSWKSFVNYIGKNAYSLLVPYFIWSLIYLPFSLDSMYRILYGSCEMFITSGVDCVQMWFLPCLFLVRVAMYGILYIENKFKKHGNVIIFIIAIFSFVIGFILPKLPNGYPWCFNIMFVALGLVISGYVWANLIKKVDTKSVWFQLPFIVISAILLWVGNKYGETTISFTSMCTADYGNVFWFIFNSFFGIILFRALSTLISKININSKAIGLKKMFVWIGQNTMGIYLLHKPFFVYYVVNGVSKLLNASVRNIGVCILCTVIIILFCSIITLFINKFTPMLFGYSSKR